MRALAKRPSSRNSNPAPDSFFVKADYPTGFLIRRSVFLLTEGNPCKKSLCPVVLRPPQQECSFRRHRQEYDIPVSVKKTLLLRRIPFGR